MRFYDMAAGGVGGRYGDGDTLRIDRSADGQGLCLDGRGTTTDWTPVQMSRCYSRASDQYWYLSNPDSKGHYQIVNYHTGMCLDDRNGAPFTGNLLQVYHCAAKRSPRGDENYAQFWKWIRERNKHLKEL